MSIVVYYYKLYCETESKFVYVWSSEVPTVCPNDPTHTVRSAQALRELKENVVYVDDKENNTNGHYAYEEWALTIPPNSTQTDTISYPYDIGIIGVIYKDQTSLSGCIVNTFVNRNTPVAALIAPTSIDSDILTVNSTQYMERGYLLKVNNELLGCIVEVKSATQVQVEQTPSTIHMPGSLTLMSVWNVRNVRLGGSNARAKLRSRNSNSSALQAGYVVTIEVQNTTNDTQVFEYGMEFFY